MSKTLSFRGILDMGVPQKIKLSTLNGKTGYKIKNFQTMSESPGVGNMETVTKIYSKQQTDFPATVDFTEGDLLGVLYYQDNEGEHYSDSSTIIFDNEIFNQDIFIYAEDASSGTKKMNYYIELETMSLTDIQATQLTLKNLRTIASR
tara:strand:+ start:18 stop:461 length:444 start_codon:yes stop_codon:yes gene_type:complete